MDRDELRASLAHLARIHKSPKALLKAVLDRHPKAKKKDVAHEAYRLMIEASDSVEALPLQDVAISLRTSV
jgi:hypothetical protein